MNKKDFAVQMAVLEEVFNKTMSDKKAQIYFRLLNNYSVKSLEKAVAHLLKTKRITTFPLPAEIIEAIEGTPTDKAMKALEKARRAQEDYGYYDSVKFDEPAIHSVIEAMGGWLDFAKVDLYGYPAKEFCDFYYAFSRDTTKRHVERLIGRHEIDNRGKGLIDHIPRTIFIGDNGIKALPKKEAKQIEAGSDKPLKKEVKEFVRSLEEGDK